MLEMSGFFEDEAASNKNVKPTQKQSMDTSIHDEVDDFLAKFLDLSNEAKDNDSKERSMPLSESIKTFPKAAFWSVVLSSALIMEGFDTNLINSFFTFPAFQKKFGTYYPESDSWGLEAKWQTTLSLCVYVGEIFGLFIAGIIADRIGYRKTLIGALAMVIGFIFIVFFAQNVQMLVAGELLLGIPWGAFQTLSISYASEVCPMVLRVYLTTYVNVCWVFGQLISAGILRALVNSNSEWSFRIPFALQWAWPIPIMIGIFLAPESPWWLVKKGRLESAKQSVNRLLTENSHLPDKSVMTVAMVNKMQLTVESERTSKNEATYWDCFKGPDFRRTRIAVGVWVVQNFTGSALMGYSAYFYTQAGLAPSMAFTFTIIQYVLGIVGCIQSWFLAKNAGRFTIYFSGLCTQFVILVIVGALGCSSDKNASWGIGSMLLVFTLVYNSSVGPLCYCIVAEMPSVKLRTKTLIIARNAYNVAGIVIAVITPQMLNPEAWNWKAKTGFFWAGFALAGLIWCWFDLPETKNKTFADLDALFENRIASRKFKSTELATFDVGRMMENLGEEGIKAVVQHHENPETEKV